MPDCWVWTDEGSTLPFEVLGWEDNDDEEWDDDLDWDDEDEEDEEWDEDEDEEDEEDWEEWEEEFDEDDDNESVSRKKSSRLDWN